MERRAFLISLGLSALSMYLVYQYISSEDAKMQEDYATFFPMVVASRDILQFQTIRPTDIETIRVPKSMDTPGRISDPKDVIDSVAAVPITKGEFLIDNKIISKNTYSGLDTQVALGRRALSISVNPQNTLGYNLRPGNRVDLAAHFDYKGQGSTISEVKVFLQDLLILSVGKTIQSNAPRGVDQNILQSVMKEFQGLQDKKEAHDMLNFAKTETQFNTITLEVTPQQAQVILYVTTVYAESLRVLLRHSDDRTLARRSTTNLQDVMGPESFLVRGRKVPPSQILSPRPKFFDFIGDSTVPVR